MNAFVQLQQFFQKNMGNIGATRGIMRTPPDIAVEDTELRRLSKGHMEEALKTAKDHGIDPTSEEGKAKVRQILEAIARRKSDAGTQKNIELDQNIEKVSATDRPAKSKASAGIGLNPDRGTYPTSDPCGGWAWTVICNELGEEYCGDVRAETGSSWRPGDGPKAQGSPVNEYHSRLFDYCKAGKKGPKPTFRGDEDEDQDSSNIAGPAQLMMLKQRISKGMSPALANLLAAAAGWALSADVASKEIPSHMSQEWERTLSRKEKERLQEEMLRKLGKKVRKSDDGSFLDEFGILYKDHAPIPPRQGLMFDAVKHRWTRPEKLGRTVWEVQGHKRFRGTGTGAHERGRSGKGVGGYGVGSAAAGRKFRSTGDVTHQHPSEAKHPSERTLVSVKRRKRARRRTHGTTSK